MTTTLPAETCPECGGQLLIKKNSLFLGRYKIVSMMDMTSMSQIYLTLDKNMENRPTILKLLFKDDTPETDAPGESTRMEQNVAARVSHPNLVTIYDAGMTNANEHFLLMEFIDGENLHDVIEKEGRLSFVRTARIMMQVCDALNAIHKAGYIHKDMKPANIMLVNNDEPGQELVKVLDFGISQPIHPAIGGLNRKNEIVGTPAYMSPEHTRKAFVGIHSDIYSAGIMMHEMLMGKPPFEYSRDSLIDAQRKYTPESLKMQGITDLPVSIDDLILQMLSKNTNLRPASCEEVKKRIEQALNPWRASVKEKKSENKQKIGTRIKFNKSDKFLFHPEELRRIMESLPPKMNESPPLWQISGVRGIGKTRLIKTIVSKAEDMGMDTYIFPYPGGDYPIEVLRSLVYNLSVEKAPDRKSINTALSALLQQSGIDMHEDIVQRVDNLLQKPENILKPGNISTNILENYIFATVYSVLEAIAIRNPTLICFDDCHMYDSMFKRFLRFLQARITNTRVPVAMLILEDLTATVTGDAEENSCLEGIYHLKLKPLPNDRMKTFLHDIFPLRPGYTLAKRLIELSDGYPAHIKMFCRYINSIKGFIIQDEKIRLIRNEMLDEIPPNIEEIQKQRIQEFGTRGKQESMAVELLKRIALMGTSAKLTTLAILLNAEARNDLKENLNLLLNILTDQTYLLPRSNIEKDELTISKPLHEIILRKMALSESRPVTLTAVAHAIEQSPSNRLSDNYKRLADLYEQAGDINKAVDYHILMSRQSHARFDFQNTAKQLQIALGLLTQKGDINSAQGQLIGRELGSVLKDMGRFSEALEAYNLQDDSIKVKTANPMELNELLEITSVLVSLREYRRATRMLKALTKKLEDTHARLMAAECHLLYTEIHMWQGKPDKALGSIKKAEEHLEGHQITPIHWMLALQRAKLLITNEQPDIAIKVLNKILSSLDRPFYYYLKAEALGMKGLAEIRMGRMEQARQTINEGYDLSKQYSYKNGMAANGMNLAVLDFFQGDCESSEKLCSHTLELNKEIGDPYFDTSIHIVQSYIHICNNRLDKATELAKKALDISHRHSYALGQGVALLRLAVIYSHQDRWTDAERFLKRAKGFISPAEHSEIGYINFNKPEIDALTGRILLHKGDVAGAREKITLAIEEFTALGRTMEAERATGCLERINRVATADAL